MHCLIVILCMIKNFNLEWNLLNVCINLHVQVDGFWFDFYPWRLRLSMNVIDCMRNTCEQSISIIVSVEGLGEGNWKIVC